MQLYRAKPVDAHDSHGLHATVAKLAQRVQLPMPKIYIIDSDAPNAFATGRNPQHASVAATTGILRMLSQEELMPIKINFKV